MSRAALAVAALLAVAAVPASAQSALTLPPSGDNQRSVVTQYMGLVSASIDYSSPDVTSPTGEDRRGKIWGQLVPYGMTDLGFNGGKPSPWRAGANENTVFTVSHDVLVEGQPLPAGRYGLHMIPGPEEWTVVFSKNSSTWGSYWYEPSGGRPARHGQAGQERVPALADLRVRRPAAGLERRLAAVGGAQGAVQDLGAQRQRALLPEGLGRAARRSRLRLPGLRERGAVRPAARHPPRPGPGLGREGERPAAGARDHLHPDDQGAGPRQARPRRGGAPGGQEGARPAVGLGDRHPHAGPPAPGAGEGQGGGRGLQAQRQALPGRLADRGRPGARPLGARRVRDGAGAREDGAGRRPPTRRTSRRSSGR